MTSVLTSVFDLHALALAAIEQKRINPTLEVKLNEMSTEEDSNRKDEHLYPIKNPQFFIHHQFPWHQFNVILRQ